MEIIVSMQMDTTLEVMVDIKLRWYDLFMHLRVQQFYGVINFIVLCVMTCLINFVVSHIFANCNRLRGEH